MTDKTKFQQQREWLQISDSRDTPEQRRIDAALVKLDDEEKTIRAWFTATPHTVRQTIAGRAESDAKYARLGAIRVERNALEAQMPKRTVNAERAIALLREELQQFTAEAAAHKTSFEVAWRDNVANGVDMLDRTIAGVATAQAVHDFLHKYSEHLYGDDLSIVAEALAAESRTLSLALALNGNWLPSTERNAFRRARVLYEDCGKSTLLDWIERARTRVDAWLSTLDEDDADAIPF